MKKKKGLSRSSEDYLEAIYLICKRNGQARSKDIMERLGVSGPSVTEALQLLRRKNMVDYQPYSPVRLTVQGEAVGRKILLRHRALQKFFIEVLGLDEETAEEGACALEHTISPRIIERMVEYSQYLQMAYRQNWRSRVEEFNRFLNQDLEKSKE
ncbi:MAG: metal-dependent transcriptional regulator [Desulfopila sp.]